MSLSTDIVGMPQGRTDKGGKVRGRGRRKGEEGGQRSSQEGGQRTEHQLSKRGGGQG